MDCKLTATKHWDKTAQVQEINPRQISGKVGYYVLEEFKD